MMIVEHTDSHTALKDKKLIIFDADGTLRKALSNPYAPNTPNDWVLLPGVADWFLANGTSYNFGIASNQGGVAVPSVPLTIENATLALEKLASILHIPYKAIRLAPTMDKSDSSRKPNSGMLISIAICFGIQISEALMVGDRDEDACAASSCGMDFINASHFFATAN